LPGLFGPWQVAFLHLALMLTLQPQQKNEHEAINGKTD
jgi:hypothetical protein